MRNKFVKTLATTAVIAAMTLFTACGQTTVGQLPDSAASRLQSEEGDVHYIDDDAIALAGEAATAGTNDAVQQALAIVNNKRASAGLGELEWNNGLEAAAQVRAQECTQAFSHTRPNGTDWWTVNSNIMYGENLAYNYSNANSVVDAWMASPTHAANIMNGGYEPIGMAAYQSSTGTW